MADRYERIYDVGLLDDLHNYFPGLLYEPDRFRTVTDVLTYIRQNASRRFNLFDYGARQYQNTRVPRTNGTPQNTFTRQPPVVNRWIPPAGQPPVVQPSHLEFDLTSAVDMALLSPLLRTLAALEVETTQPIRRAHGQNRFTGLFQDVIIHGSQELIDSASTMRTLLMDLEGTCSICQDRMRQDENIRRLNACQHEFHGACVDNWLLQRSVLCPVCRHDIRNPTPAIRSPTLGPTPNTLQHTQAIPPLVPRDETDDDSPNETVPTLRTRSDINSMFNRRLE
jgi:hypothetical protein